MPAIAVAALSKTFGAVTAVDQVSFDVHDGEVFGVIGPDGAGKTTLMRMLAGIMPPTGGDAMVAGCPVVSDPEAVKQRIGYLSQVFSLYGDLTVDENLDFVADLYGEPLDRVRDAKQAMLAMTGMAQFANRQAGRLSGGMKQKLGLMCALIHRPTVLLLDEPTTGVDPISRQDFWRILADLPSQGVTVLLSSPYMDEASRCHRLALVDRGRMLAVGTVGEITAQLDGYVLEVVTGEVRVAARTLEGQAGVLGLTAFGDALHVRVASSVQPATLRGWLAAGGLTDVAVEPAEASLEDAFIDLVQRANAADAGAAEATP